jgi:CBS domain-containing protein
MSPRAACRLEALGFTDVYDYVLGIADWKAAGLSVEGVGDDKLRVQDAMRSGIPTCRPSDRVVEVKRRVFDSGWEECLVLDCNRMVVGRLRGRAWDEVGTATDAMEVGPSTVRPDALLRPLLERMSKRSTSLVTVTTPQGTLLGVLMREDSQ